MTDLPLPDLLIELPDGRTMAVDDRGDPSGTPVLYVHGTPDSRLARHPDDAVAAAAGVRLIAADRPGIGGSDPDPAATPASVADDLAAVLAALDVAEAGVLSWSAGSLFALAFAGAHATRCRCLVLAAPLVPADGYEDPAVVEGADEGRRLFADVQRGMHPDEVGDELAPWLVPAAIDDATARDLMAGSIAALADIPGADDQLAVAVRASVAQGHVGVVREIAAQAIPLAPLLDRIRADVRIHVGADDTVTPPAMASWIAHRLGAELVVHGDVGHELAIRCWPMLLAEATGP